MRNLTKKTVMNVSMVAGLMAMIIVAGCEGCFSKGAIRDAKVENCNIHANDEGACNTATENGVRCEFDKATGECRKSDDRKTESCEKLSMEECKASKFCTYSDATTSCLTADTALAGKCDVIQDKDSCAEDENCAWNDTALVCEQKK